MGSFKIFVAYQSSDILTKGYQHQWLHARAGCRERADLRLAASPEFENGCVNVSSVEMLKP